jgi:hypothetical protein
VTGVEVHADGEYPGEDMAAKVGRVARTGALDRARYGLVRTVQQTTGAIGVMGLAMGSSAVSKKVDERRGDAPRHSDRQIHGAVVAAFEKVAAQFRWDDAGRRWISRDAPGPGQSPFDSHVGAHPVTTDHDRRMLARMLATIVGAEGGASADERAMFVGLAPGTDLDALIAQWAPSATELGAVTAGPVRETMVLLAWAVAVTDDQLSPREIELLDWYPAALAIPAPRAAELRATALRHVLDETAAELARDGLDRAAVLAEVQPLATRIGLDAAAAAASADRQFA